MLMCVYASVIPDVNTVLACQWRMHILYVCLLIASMASIRNCIILEIFSGVFSDIYYSYNVLIYMEDIKQRIKSLLSVLTG